MTQLGAHSDNRLVAPGAAAAPNRIRTRFRTHTEDEPGTPAYALGPPTGGR